MPGQKQEHRTRRKRRSQTEAAGVGFPSDTAMRVVSRRYHLHFPGLVYIATTVMLAFGAVQSQNNLLFWAFGIAVAGLLISGIVSGSSLMGLELARTGVSEAPAGQTQVIRYVVLNHGRVFPAMALNIEELDAAPRGKGDAAVTSFPVGCCELVAPRSTAEAIASSRALRRGRGTLRRVRVWTTYPFGLTRKSVTFERAAETIVLPHAPRVRAEAIRRLISADQRGVSTSAARGISDEFWALREYRPGDPMRQIAWKASARTGQLVVRQTTALSPVRLWIEVGPHEADRMERAISLAAGVISCAAGLGWAMGLYIPGSAVCIAPHDGHRHAGVLMRGLALAGEPTERAPGPGPKLGEAVLRIGDGPSPGRNRTSISIEQAASLLAPGESLTPPAPATGSQDPVRRLLSRLFGAGGGNP
jgi:uncharacterized protein (DUF58 family)